MGTDIYMRWRQITDAERDAQVTGFAVNAGAEGYLRASIGMQLENAILRRLFPSEYWSEETTKPYDFQGNYGDMLAMALPYLSACYTGQELGTADELLAKIRSGQMVEQLKGVLGGGEVKVPGAERGHALKELRFGLVWYTSLVQFFDLGMEKQEAKLRPYPLISW